MSPDSLLLPPDLQPASGEATDSYPPVSIHRRVGGWMLLTVAAVAISVHGRVAHSASVLGGESESLQWENEAESPEVRLHPSVAWAVLAVDSAEGDEHDEAEVLPPLPPSLQALVPRSRVVHASMPVEGRTPIGFASMGFAGLTYVPFDEKRGEFLGGQRLGYWPAERRGVRDPAYANPDGFYVVDAASARHPVSPNFTIGEFAMHNAPRGPSGETYVVLRPVLVEKLDRLIAELERRGVRGADLRILSGFRAPHYNSGVEGAAPSSRHQFGDAADIIVDADGDGRMDDLNGDGRVDRKDIWLVAAALEQVERDAPHLVGGLGLYNATGPSGPFLHVDVRGKVSRWGTALRGAPLTDLPQSTPARSAAASFTPLAVRTSTCRAEGDMVALCATRKRTQD